MRKNNFANSATVGQTTDVHRASSEAVALPTLPRPMANSTTVGRTRMDVSRTRLDVDQTRTDADRVKRDISKVRRLMKTLVVMGAFTLLAACQNQPTPAAGPGQPGGTPGARRTGGAF